MKRRYGSKTVKNWNKTWQSNVFGKARTYKGVNKARRRAFIDLNL